MKIRRSILGFIVIVAALIALALWFGKKEPAKTPVAVSPATNVTPAAVAATRPPSSAPVHSNTQPSGQPATTIPASALKPREQRVREDLATLNNEDVVFYGRVIDQFSNAVADATVTSSIQVNNGTRVGDDKISLLTDANGFFTISGYKGKALGIWVKKEGYVMATTNTYFIYSLLWPASRRFTPDPNNPTVIKMWKLQGAEPLVDISKEYKLPFTSSPIFFDLVAGKVVATGRDLEAVVTRASGSLSKRNPGDWSLELKPVNGGIIESDYHAAQFTFEAPADGYQDDYLVQMNHDDPAWRDGIAKEFFFKSRNGRVYGKFYLVFGINREPSASLYFQFRGEVNRHYGL